MRGGGVRAVVYRGQKYEGGCAEACLQLCIQSVGKAQNHRKVYLKPAADGYVLATCKGAGRLPVHVVVNVLHIADQSTSRQTTKAHDGTWYHVRYAPDPSQEDKDGEEWMDIVTVDWAPGGKYACVRRGKEGSK